MFNKCKICKKDIHHSNAYFHILYDLGLKQNEEYATGTLCIQHLDKFRSFYDKRYGCKSFCEIADRPWNPATIDDMAEWIAYYVELMARKGYLGECECKNKQTGWHCRFNAIRKVDGKLYCNFHYKHYRKKGIIQEIRHSDGRVSSRIVNKAIA